MFLIMFLNQLYQTFIGKTQDYTMLLLREEHMINKPAGIPESLGLKKKLLQDEYAS